MRRKHKLHDALLKDVETKYNAATNNRILCLIFVTQKKAFFLPSKTRNKYKYLLNNAKKKKKFLRCNVDVNFVIC